MAEATNTTPTPSAQIDPHVVWYASLTEVQAQRMLAGGDDENNRLTDQVLLLWKKIGLTRARTLAGARIQIECVAEQLLSGISGDDALRERTALANAAATLDRMAEASELLAVVKANNALIADFIQHQDEMKELQESVARMKAASQERLDRLTASQEASS